MKQHDSILPIGDTQQKEINIQVSALQLNLLLPNVIKKSEVIVCLNASVTGTSKSAQLVKQVFFFFFSSLLLLNSTLLNVSMHIASESSCLSEVPSKEGC